MSLSNWDTLAVNQDGVSNNGVFVSPLGVRVRIYKNWLYVHDQKSWQEGGQFLEPTVMEIMKGELIYKDIHFLVKRGPQFGVFCIVYIPSWMHVLVEGQEDKKFKAMIGAGVYGFHGEDWVGVNDKSLSFLNRMILDNDSPREIKDLDLSKSIQSR